MGMRIEMEKLGVERYDKERGKGEGNMGESVLKLDGVHARREVQEGGEVVI